LWLLLLLLLLLDEEDESDLTGATAAVVDNLAVVEEWIRLEIVLHAIWMDRWSDSISRSFYCLVVYFRDLISLKRDTQLR